MSDTRQSDIILNARNRLITVLYDKGHSLSELATKFDLSKSRISQIVNTKNEH